MRQPFAEEWCTPDMSVDDILQKIRYNGSKGFRANYAFFRVQSGHKSLQQQDRPGWNYDFRHQLLIHKTTHENWLKMSSRNDRHLRCRGRDIHLVPYQFLHTEATMLRDYGNKVLIFNLNNEQTCEALSTAKETPNGYILVSEHIHLDRLEAVYDLDLGQMGKFLSTYDTSSEPR